MIGPPSSPFGKGFDDGSRTVRSIFFNRVFGWWKKSNPDGSNPFLDCLDGEQQRLEPTHMGIFGLHAGRLRPSKSGGRSQPRFPPSLRPPPVKSPSHPIHLLIFSAGEAAPTGSSRGGGVGPRWHEQGSSRGSGGREAGQRGRWRKTGSGGPGARAEEEDKGEKK